MYCSQALFGASQAWRLAGPQFGLGRLAPVTVLMRATLIFEAVPCSTDCSSFHASFTVCSCVCVRIQKVFTLFLLVSLQNGLMMYIVHQSWVCSVHSTVEMLNHTCSMSAQKYFFKYSLYIVHILANFSSLSTLILQYRY